jgi:hypothetical protein
MRRDDSTRLVTILIPIITSMMSACLRIPPSDIAARDDHMSIVIERGALASIRVPLTARLSAAQLDSVGVRTAAEAIALLRPDWLRPLEAIARQEIGPSVYLNDTFVGGPEELRMIPVARVGELRLLTPSMGFDRLGYTCRCAGGLILVLDRAR